MYNDVKFSPHRGLEEFIRYHPQLINLQKDDGFSPLHIAAVNDHCDLVSFIASHVSLKHIDM